MLVDELSPWSLSACRKSIVVLKVSVRISAFDVGNTENIEDERRVKVKGKEGERAKSQKPWSQDITPE